MTKRPSRQVGKQASRKVGKQPSMDTSAPDSEIKQDSPLLRLPGEIRNRIYDLFIPSSKVLLRAQREETKAGPIVRFHPQPEGITRTCRELRAETLKLYYARGTFVFTDNMFEQGIITAFAKARAQGIAHMKELRIRHKPLLRTILFTFQGDTFSKERYPAENSTRSFKIEFSAQVKGMDEIVVTDFLTSGGGSSNSSRRDGLCCCFLEDLCKKPSEVNGEGGPPLQFLLNYSLELPETSLVDEVCDDCGRMRARKRTPNAIGALPSDTYAVRRV